MKNLSSFLVSGIIGVVCLIVIAIAAVLACLAVILILAGGTFLSLLSFCLPKHIYKLSLDIKEDKDPYSWDWFKHVAISSGRPEKEVRMKALGRELSGPFFRIFFSESRVVKGRDPIILLKGPALLLLFSWLIKSRSQKCGMQIRSVETV